MANIIVENIIMEPCIEKIIFVDNFWGNKIIPAILRGPSTILLGRSNVWIPHGYDGTAGGYSTRKTLEIKEFTGTDEVRQDVMKKWAEEQKR
jgi:hypothetical protein